LKKPPYRVYRKKEEKPPVHLPEKIDTPEAEQFISDLYRVGQFVAAHWKKIAAVVAILVIVIGSYGGYVWHRNLTELKAAEVVDRGLFLLRSGKEKEALDLFHKALSEYPSAPSTGIAKFLIAKLEGKEKLLKELTETDSFLLAPPSKTSLAAIKIDRDKPEVADRVLSLMKRDRDWTYPEAVYERLLIALKKGNFSSAREAIEILRGDYRNLPITVLAQRIIE
jgi:outer membrane protein assembly factor BamD (BamD/ComL family)